MRSTRFKMSSVLLLLLLFASSSVLTACSLLNKSDTNADLAAAGGLPALDAQLDQNGTAATISYKVRNLAIAGDRLGETHTDGQGHLHLYVDGVQKAMLKTDAPVRLENIPPGKHTIKLSLQQNDHVAINVEKVFEIEVKK
ncbi:hypothetical protein [Paenibacillus lutrae]|uniref:YtkA-like domain-containing protein n=1 Tax=Paenibacillus lutrae TaxID=2078573 RepID=A0A7X3K149_9BACL|nr:hypothetical protein [Paenibacillus lutrae]MVP01611.1 hypothetical protein [Paenibacillus lutrae]